MGKNAEAAESRNPIRDVYAANLKKIWEWAPERGMPSTATALEQASGVTDSAINRHLKGDVPKRDERGEPQGGAVNIDQLAKIAQVYKLPAWQLLYPNLDPANPPEVLTPDRIRELQETFVAAARLLGIDIANGIGANGLAGESNNGAASRQLPSKEPRPKPSTRG